MFEGMAGVFHQSRHLTFTKALLLISDFNSNTIPMDFPFITEEENNELFFCNSRNTNQ